MCWSPSKVRQFSGSHNSQLISSAHAEQACKADHPWKHKRGPTAPHTTRVDATSWISTPVELTASLRSITAVSLL